MKTVDQRGVVLRLGDEIGGLRGVLTHLEDTLEEIGDGSEPAALLQALELLGRGGIGRVGHLEEAGDGVVADERRVDVGDGALDLVEGGELGAGHGRPDGDGGPDAAHGAAGGARAAERKQTAGGARGGCASRADGGQRIGAGDAAEVGDAGRHYSRDAGSLYERDPTDGRCVRSAAPNGECIGALEATVLWINSGGYVTQKEAHIL